MNGIDKKVLLKDMVHATCSSWIYGPEEYIQELLGPQNDDDPSVDNMRTVYGFTSTFYPTIYYCGRLPSCRQPVIQDSPPHPAWMYMMKNHCQPVILYSPRQPIRPGI